MILALLQWNWCCDITVLGFAPLTPEQKAKYLFPKSSLPGANLTTLLHAGVHWAVGSLAPGGACEWAAHMYTYVCTGSVGADLSALAAAASAGC